MVLLSSRPNHETWNAVRNEELRLEGRSSPILEHGAREIKPSESGSGVVFVPRAERRKKQHGTTRKEVHICSGGMGKMGELRDCRRDSGVEYK